MKTSFDWLIGKCWIDEFIEKLNLAESINHLFLQQIEFGHPLNLSVKEYAELNSLHMDLGLNFKEYKDCLEDEIIEQYLEMVQQYRKILNRKIFKNKTAGIHSGLAVSF